MTNQQAIDRALQAIQFLASSDSANSTDSADAMVALNAMMAEWEFSSRDIGWFPQDDLTETTPVPRWAEKAVIFNLAVELGDVFTVQVPPTVFIAAEKGLNMVTRTVINETLENADMTHLPLGRNYGDILNGP